MTIPMDKINPNPGTYHNFFSQKPVQHKKSIPFKGCFHITVAGIPLSFPESLGLYLGTVNTRFPEKVPQIRHHADVSYQVKHLLLRKREV